MKTATRAGWPAMALAAVCVFPVTACGGGGDHYGSPILDEDIPVADIADLPDIDQTRTQMSGLIEQVRTEVVHVVPASEPWRLNREEARAGCTQEGTGRKGVSLYFANLVSTHAFTDAEWATAYPVVRRLAEEAGLTDASAMQDSSGSHDVRFGSDDGRSLTFGSQAASLISGSIACRRAASHD